MRKSQDNTPLLPGHGTGAPQPAIHVKDYMTKDSDIPNSPEYTLVKTTLLLNNDLNSFRSSQSPESSFYRKVSDNIVGEQAKFREPSSSQLKSKFCSVRSFVISSFDSPSKTKSNRWLGTYRTNR